MASTPSTHQAEDNSLLENPAPGSEQEEGQEAAQPEKTTAPRKTTLSTISASLTQWWPELISCTFAVGILFLLCLVLQPYQGEVLSAWPLDITINTFVAICILLIKVSLGFIVGNGIGQLKWTWYSQARPLVDLQRYDSASRGVLGSLGLLWAHRGKRAIPAVGAILTAVLTLVDPFGQALVRLEDCTVVDSSGSNSIGVTHYAVVQDEVDSDIVNYDTVGPIIIGLLYQSLSPGAPVECSTSNCTFPNPYHSAGFCSQCRDDSDKVTLINNTGWRWDDANMTLSKNEGSYLQDGKSYVMALGVEETKLASIQIMASQLQGCTNNDTTPWGCRGYGAATCQIHDCVISYAGDVDVHGFYEMIVNTSASWSNGSASSLRGTIDVSCLNTTELNAMHEAGLDVDKDTEWMPYDVPLGVDEWNDTVLETTIARPECIYVADDDQMGVVTRLLRSGFTNAQVYQLGKRFAGDVSGDLLWQALWARGSLDFYRVKDAFDGLAKGLTYSARTHQSDRVKLGENLWSLGGTAYRNTTCVRIAWQWIAYPATAVLGAMVFLIGTMVMTRTTLGMNGRDYRNSILPLMFHGIALADGAMVLRAPESMREMKAEAKDMYVKFEETELGWRFLEKKMS